MVWEKVTHKRRVVVGPAPSLDWGRGMCFELSFRGKEVPAEQRRLQKRVGREEDIRLECGA